MLIVQKLLVLFLPKNVWNKIPREQNSQPQTWSKRKDRSFFTCTYLSCKLTEEQNQQTFVEPTASLRNINENLLTCTTTDDHRYTYNIARDRVCVYRTGTRVWVCSVYTILCSSKWTRALRQTYGLQSAYARRR